MRRNSITANFLMQTLRQLVVLTPARISGFVTVSDDLPSAGDRGAEL